MFSHSSELYDAIYHWKNYARESERAREIVDAHRRSEGRALLDVACGTGGHIPYLRKWFQVEGLDLDEGLLDVARVRHPETRFHHADMTSFDLGRTFDVVACLFSGIGYARTMAGLRAAVASMERHLAPGGVLLIEPWIFEGQFHVGVLHGTYVDREDLKISRMNVSQEVHEAENPISVLSFYYQVGRPSGITQFTETHELGLFRRDDYLDAFRQVGLDVEYDADGLMGRGLFIGRKPL